MIDILMSGTTGRVERRVSRLAVPFTVLGCMVVLSSCSTVNNTVSDKDFNKRVYIGAGALVSKLEPDTSEVAGASVDDSSGSGGSLTLGYDMSNRFTIEGHLASLGDATIDPAGSIGYSVGGISALYYGLNDAGDRALRRGFSVYGRLGLGAMENDASGVEFERVNDVHLLAGVGLEYGTTRGLGFRAELVAHETDARYAQLGLVYRFGAQGSGTAEGSSQSARSSTVDDVPVTGAIVDELPPVRKPTEKPSPVKPTPARVKDVDGDGVPDASDQCQDTVADTPVNEDGCPIFGGVIEGINFQPGSDRLTPQALRVLAGVAETLLEYPDVRIVIEAHTDNEGTAAANLQLSKRRAIAVARYLVDAGISGSRLKPQAYGESKPRTSNLTAQGRAANRRVEFSLLP